jgi:hypothetical protein
MDDTIFFMYKISLLMQLRTLSLFENVCIILDYYKIEFEIFEF